MTSQVSELQKSLSSLQVFLSPQQSKHFFKNPKHFLIAARDGLYDKQAAAGVGEQGDHRRDSPAADKVGKCMVMMMVMMMVLMMVMMMVMGTEFSRGSMFDEDDHITR